MAMAKKVLRVSDFSGGRNTRDARNAVQPFQSPNDLNMIATSPNQIRRRKGYVQWVNKVFGENTIRGMFRYIKRDGTKYLMVAAGGSVWACEGDYPFTSFLEVASTVPDSSTVLPSGTEYHFAQMQDWVYMANPDIQPLRWNGPHDGSGVSPLAPQGDAVLPVGFRAQTSLPAPVLGAAGEMIGTAANPDYYYVFTAVFGALGEAVPYFVVSGQGYAVDLGAITNGSVAWSGLYAYYRDRTQTAINFYRATQAPSPLGGAPHTYYYVGTDAGTGAFTDTLNDLALVDVLETDVLFTRLNIPKFRYVFTHGNRMFWLNVTGGSGTTSGWNYPSRYYASALYQPDRLTFEDNIFPDDGAEITGGISYLGKAVLFKSNSMHALYGSSEDDFERRQIDSRIGCVAPRSIVIGDGILHWLSRDGVYTYDGSGVQRISDEIQPDINSFSNTRMTSACAGWHDGKYFISIPEA
jgi:hypothetical protein